MDSIPDTRLKLSASRVRLRRRRGRAYSLLDGLATLVGADWLYSIFETPDPAKADGRDGVAAAWQTVGDYLYMGLDAHEAEVREALEAKKASDFGE